MNLYYLLFAMLGLALLVVFFMLAGRRTFHLKDLEISFFGGKLKARELHVKPDAVPKGISVVTPAEFVSRQSESKSKS